MEEFFSKTCCDFSIFNDYVELRVRVREEHVKVLLGRLVIMLNFFSNLSGVRPALKDVTNLKKDSSNVVEVTILLHGWHVVFFRRLVNFVFIPAYINKYGYKPQWVFCKENTKVYFNNPNLFFNYVGGMREDFEENILIIFHRRYD